MITYVDDVCQEQAVSDWQQALAESFRDPHELLTYLQLKPNDLPAIDFDLENFGLRVPRSFAARMKKGDPNDPLLRQVLPQTCEQLPQTGYTHDPLQETHSNVQPGLIHKYHGRVLLLINPHCAIHCRYCFRRHFAYRDNHQGSHRWQQNLAYIAADRSISEVILSGGDPLMATDAWLAEHIKQLAAIPHVKRLRIHTRLPIVIPQRITNTCVQWLTNTRLQTVMVLHCNHANELSTEVTTALQMLREKGITLLNQSVLLKGVNDNAQTLTQLSEALFANGILPYYLHLLDPVQGAQHFAISEEHAKSLLQHLMAHLPGYLVPKMVREVPQGLFKVPVSCC